MNDFIQNIDVSFCNKAYQQIPSGVVPIVKLITSSKFKEAILEIRAMPVGTEEEIKAQKKAKFEKLPCFFNGIVKGGTTNDHAEAAEIIIVDADAEDNTLPAEAMFEIFSELPFVAAVAYSVRGLGIYAVVRIKRTKQNSDFHEIAKGLERDLKEKGIIIDPSCKNIARKRFFGYSDKVYFNPNIPQAYNPTKPLAVVTNSRIVNTKEPRNEIEEIIQQIEIAGIDLAPDYHEYLNIAFAFADEYGEQGRSYFHRVCRQSHKYTVEDADKKYTEAIKSKNGSVHIATFYHYLKASGISIKSPTKALLPAMQVGKVYLQRKLEHFEVLKDGRRMELTPYNYPKIWDDVPQEIIDENRKLLNNHL